MTKITGLMTFFPNLSNKLFKGIEAFIPSHIVTNLSESELIALFENDDEASLDYQRRLLQYWAYNKPDPELFSPDFKMQLFQLLQRPSFDIQHRYYGLLTLNRICYLESGFVFNDSVSKENCSSITAILYLSMLKDSEKLPLVKASIEHLFISEQALSSKSIRVLHTLIACANICSFSHSRVVLHYICNHYNEVTNLTLIHLLNYGIYVFSPLVKPENLSQLLDDLFEKLFSADCLNPDSTTTLIINLYKSSCFLRENRWDDLVKMIINLINHNKGLNRIELLSKMASLLIFKNNQEIFTILSKLSLAISPDFRMDLRFLLIDLTLNRINEMIDWSINCFNHIISFKKDKSADFLIVLAILADYFGEHHVRFLKKTLNNLPEYTQIPDSELCRDLMKKNIIKPIALKKFSSKEQFIRIDNILDALAISDIQDEAGLKLWEELTSYTNSTDSEVKPYILKKLLTIPISDKYVYLDKVLYVFLLLKKCINASIAQKAVPILLDFIDNETVQIASLALEILTLCLPFEQVSFQKLDHKQSIEANVLRRLVSLHKQVQFKIEDEITSNLAIEKLTINYT